MLNMRTSTLGTLVFSGLLLSGMAGAALAQSPAPEAEEMAPLTKVTYICERNVEVPVVYVNGLKNDESMAVISVEGKLVPMRIAPSGSGARYIALDEQDSYRWHSKGDEGILSFLEADDSAEEQVLLSKCVDKSKAENQD
ncbi:MliC family protein [Pseudochrobactrum sp. HB0163]|uniref:MliC family protein n=1 Tax=Pseudochrobactrum sp. HB0163 TaxID=3450708 RepID=UPI003F6DA7EB